MNQAKTGVPRNQRSEGSHVEREHYRLQAWARRSLAHNVLHLRGTKKGPFDCDVVKSKISLPGEDPGKDVRMPNTEAVVQLPQILRSNSSYLVKLAGKIDSFSLLLRATPDGELKRSIEDEFHRMVLATRQEIRRYCPRYRSLPGEGILDFNTDCHSGQLEPGDVGTAPPPKRGALCETCRFFAGVPEEQPFETAGSLATQGVVLVV